MVLLERQTRALIVHADAIAELLTVQRRPEDSGEQECSVSELRGLSALGKKEPVSMSELASALNVPLSTATRITDRLVEKKLVERRRVKKDRRIVEVAFSERGRDISQFITERRITLARGMLEALRPADRASLIRGMNTLLKSL